MNKELTHKSSGKVDVSANLAVHLDGALHHNLGDLIASEGVLETVSQHHHKWQRLTQLVRARGGSGSEDAAELVEHPCLRSIQTLKVLLGTASLVVVMVVVRGKRVFSLVVVIRERDKVAGPYHVDRKSDSEYAL